MWMIGLAAGCRGILGIEDPVLVDATPDGPAIDPTCPAAPPGCTPFACLGIRNCYYDCGIDVKQTWTNAGQFCTGNRLDCLAPVRNAVDAGCLGSRAKTDPIWVNYAQQTDATEPSNGWDWGCAQTNFINWAPTEPNNLTGDEDCGAIKDTGGKLFDEKCTNLYRFVCVQEL